MPKLYFMDREFTGECLMLDEAIEKHDVQLLFDDSWYWLHYRFFECRDHVRSESSSALRTHLLNLAAMLYRSFESIPSVIHRDPAVISCILEEVTAIAEYSRGFPISLWIFGDETSKEVLDETLAGLPSAEQITRLVSLPHFRQLERERLSYAHDSEKVALQRFRREQAAYNKRQKLGFKKQQREANRA